MTQRRLRCLFMAAIMAGVGMTAGCANRLAGEENRASMEENRAAMEQNRASMEQISDETTAETKELEEGMENELEGLINPGTEIMELEDGFSAVRYEGDYWFGNFLDKGGAADDAEVMDFLAGQMQFGSANPVLQTGGFGCSTLAVRNQEGDVLFGRNFDWQNCEALVVLSNPSDGAASISTVNMDFIRSGYGAEFSQLTDEIRTLTALYAPLDGMNENGFAVSVNMIQDSEPIHQDTGKPDLTTTTAIRLLLDRAADVEEALALLRQYDLHSSMGMMVHFALADKSGHSVAVEYVNQEMVVTDTSVVTNFYLAEGDKQGIGSSQSHTRYEMLMETLAAEEVMSADQVKDALESVSKKKFAGAGSPPYGRSAEGFESTEWSIVWNLNDGSARYYHRENYENSYLFQVNQVTR